MDEKIDQLVFELYGLNEEEVRDCDTMLLYYIYCNDSIDIFSLILTKSDYNARAIQ
jgi:hypothetical protein